MQKTVLVTGANGQLGKSLQQIAPEFSGRFRFLFTDVDTLDITDLAAVRRMVQDENVDFLINAAAYTAVDKAESDVDFAYLLNEKAVANLAVATKEHGAFFVHISTDYVFDGKANRPYRTTDAPNPTSVYGKSKLAGETAIVQSGCRGAIVRTAWLYSPYGNNFVKTMLRLADTRESISVVNDQTGCPTLALDLARFILAVIEHDGATEGVKHYHFTNRGEITWYDFACESFEALMETMELLFPGKKLNIVLGVLADKDFQSGLDIAIPHAKKFYAVTPPSYRALDAGTLAEDIREKSEVPVAPFDSIPAAIEAALAESDKDDVIAILGSLYQVGDVRSYFGRNTFEQ